MRFDKNIVVPADWRAQRPRYSKYYALPPALHSLQARTQEEYRSQQRSSSPRTTDETTNTTRKTHYFQRNFRQGGAGRSKRKEQKKRNPLWSDRVRTRLGIGSLPLRSERKSSRPPTGKTRTTRAHLTDGEERGRRTSRPPHTDSAKARNQLRKGVIFDELQYS